MSKASDKKHFLGILFNSRIFSHVSPQEKELFTVIVGGSRQKELCQLEPSKLKSLVLEEFMELMEVNNEPIFSNHYKYPKGIPQYNLNHQYLLDTIQNFENNNPNFHILGIILMVFLLAIVFQKLIILYKQISKKSFQL